MLMGFAELNDKPEAATPSANNSKPAVARAPKKQQQPVDRKGWNCFAGASLGVTKSWPLGWKSSQAIKELLQNLFEELPGCKLSGPTPWEGEFVVSSLPSSLPQLSVNT